MDTPNMVPKSDLQNFATKFPRNFVEIIRRIFKIRSFGIRGWTLIFITISYLTNIKWKCYRPEPVTHPLKTEQFSWYYLAKLHTCDSLFSINIGRLKMSNIVSHSSMSKFYYNCITNRFYLVVFCKNTNTHPKKPV